MTDIKTLKEFLSKISDDAAGDVMLVVDGNLSKLRHISLTDEGDILLVNEASIGTCNRCGGPVFPESEAIDIEAYCPTHDESLYSVEFTANEKQAESQTKTPALLGSKGIFE